jgi:hypothetical protein
MSKFFREEQLTNTTESLVLFLPSWEVQEGRSPGRNEREPGVLVTHSALRKLVIIDEAMKFDITRQFKIQISFAKILSTLRLNNEEFIFKTRDLYNLKTKMRCTELDSLTSIQALMRQLDETN